MDFTRRTKVLKDTDGLAAQYPHVLCLYKVPPLGQITLSEFEELAFERLQLLRVLEQATQMGNKLYSAEWKLAVMGYLRKENLRRYIRLIESTGCSAADADYQIRREDHISHFILRLAYCRSQDLRNWFIAREIELFKIRFLNLSPEGVNEFIKANNLCYFPISSEEKSSIKDGLMQSTYGCSPALIESSDFYKVPFTDVPDLVRNTSVYVSKGFAYIPTTELVSCVTSWFRADLSGALAYANKKLPYMDDDRITGLLATLHSSYTGKDYSYVEHTNSSLTADNIDTVVRKSFPLCMRNLYEVIKSTHHMKHFGRLQFGLFLKGIGLSLEEAIKYWKGEFVKLIDGETFNKKYLYNIRHSYGTIGKMTSYSPYSCRKIISTDSGPGEHHGCPFKQWDNDTLKQKMTEYGITTEGVMEVLDIAKKGHYQIACSKYFIYTHGGIESKQIINHPNQYFDESQEIVSNPLENFEKRVYKKRKQPSSSVPSNQDAVFDDDYDLSQVNEVPMEIA